MPDEAAWVVDTSVYTHLCRAGHAEILARLAPGGVILIPNDVDTEIQAGQQNHAGIPSVASTSWAQLTVLTEEEAWTQLEIKASMGGGRTQHLGECAVIACAQHRNLIALLDERAAIAQADLRGVQSRDTLWLVIEAYARFFEFDRARAVQVVDDLLTTEMYLPIDAGESLFGWAYEKGLLPRE
jgi:predicted nucleic acid-binding protein